MSNTMNAAALKTRNKFLAKLASKKDSAWVKEMMSHPEMVSFINALCAS